MKRAVLVVSLMLISSSSMAGWSYGESADPMTSKKTVNAMIESSNSLALSFPYAGKNFGTIQVRQHPTYGLDVIFFVDKGQIQCRSYEGCTVTVRFDDKPAARYSANTSADNDSKVIFLKNAKGFINAAKLAKKILVQVTMYHSGSPVLEFQTTEPLKWDGIKTAKPSPAKTIPQKPTAKKDPGFVWPEVPAILSGKQ